MTEANLIFMIGSYSNPGVIDKTIRYIYRLENPYKFCYGVWPPSAENAIDLFYQTRKMLPQNICGQQIQHLILSFEKLKEIERINCISNQIALLFSEYYPVCFALHDDEKHLHTHFIISTTSYIPNVHPLDQNILNQLFPIIARIATSNNILLKKVTKKCLNNFSTQSN